MKTLELLKNVKRIANTKAIKGGTNDDIFVSFTSIDLNNDYVLTAIDGGKDTQSNVFVPASK